MNKEKIICFYAFSLYYTLSVCRPIKYRFLFSGCIIIKSLATKFLSYYHLPPPLTQLSFCSVVFSQSEKLCANISDHRVIMRSAFSVMQFFSYTFFKILFCWNFNLMHLSENKISNSENHFRSLVLNKSAYYLEILIYRRYQKISIIT